MGRQNVFYYDDNGNVIEEINSLGILLPYTYDSITKLHRKLMP